MKNTKNIIFFRDPRINGIEISCVEKSRHVFPNHVHDNIYALSLIIQGASYCLGKNKSDKVVHAGEMVLLNPGQVHSGVPIDGHPISYWMLYADIKTLIDFTGDIFERKDLIPEFKTLILKNKHIADNFHSVLMAFAHTRDGLLKETLLYEFLNRLFIQACKVKPSSLPMGHESKAIRMAKRYLSQNLDTDISLESMARQAGFSRFHFIRVFKKQTGISPHQFRIQQRIQAAKGMIRKGIPFSEIALETGFSDQSHFTNSFRHYTGATPTQYAHF